MENHLPFTQLHCLARPLFSAPQTWRFPYHFLVLKFYKKILFSSKTKAIFWAPSPPAFHVLWGLGPWEREASTFKTKREKLQERINPPSPRFPPSALRPGINPIMLHISQPQIHTMQEESLLIRWYNLVNRAKKNFFFLFMRIALSFCSISLRATALSRAIIDFLLRW